MKTNVQNPTRIKKQGKRSTRKLLKNDDSDAIINLITAQEDASFAVSTLKSQSSFTGLSGESTASQKRNVGTKSNVGKKSGSTTTGQKRNVGTKSNIVKKSGSNSENEKNAIEEDKIVAKSVEAPIVEKFNGVSTFGAVVVKKPYDRISIETIRKWKHVKGRESASGGKWKTKKGRQSASGGKWKTKNGRQSASGGKWKTKKGRQSASLVLSKAMALLKGRALWRLRAQKAQELSTGKRKGSNIPYVISGAAWSITNIATSKTSRTFNCGKKNRSISAPGRKSVFRIVGLSGQTNIGDTGYSQLQNIAGIAFSDKKDGDE